MKGFTLPLHVVARTAPVRGLKNVERVAQALYRLQPRLLESDYGSACRWLGLKNRKRSLICLMTDVIDRDSSAVIIGYLARFARTHLPLVVTLSDPQVKALAEAPLERSPNLYAKAAAIDVLAARAECEVRGQGQRISADDADGRR